MRNQLDKSELCDECNNIYKKCRYYSNDYCSLTTKCECGKSMPKYRGGLCCRHNSCVDCNLSPKPKQDGVSQRLTWWRWLHKQLRS